MPSSGPSRVLLLASLEKTLKTLNLYLHSANKLKIMAPAILNSPDDLEPYDALVSRFERAVDVFLGKLTKSLNLFETGTTGDTLRDRLNLMEKLGLISATETWIEMREVRNRIAHDYLPETVMDVYNLLLSSYKEELSNLKMKLLNYKSTRKL